MWLSYFIPQSLAKFSSRYNHDIRVLEDQGKPKLLVNGSPQSGPYIKWLWQKALHAFSFPKTAQSILVLGVGGGTVIELLHKKFPGAEIIGIDIDPMILTIAKTYFHLDAIPHLTLTQGDVKKVIPFFARSKKQFDIIVVDLFFGREIPKFVSSEQFLRQLKILKGKDGVILMNFLREHEYKEASDILEKHLKTLFGTVRDYQIRNNRFFLMMDASVVNENLDPDSSC